MSVELHEIKVAGPEDTVLDAEPNNKEIKDWLQSLRRFLTYAKSREEMVTISQTDEGELVCSSLPHTIAVDAAT